MKLVGPSLAAASAAVGAPLGLLALALRPAWREGLAERLGRHPGVVRAGSSPIWVHAASVGETRAAAALLAALGARGQVAVASTLTTAGRNVLRTLRPEVPTGLAPLDHPWCTRAAMRRVRPAALVLVETELWPSLIKAAAEVGAAVLISSGRLSDRSFPRYLRAKRLLRPTLERIAAVGARSATDAERFCALGVPSSRVVVTGDLKLDAGSVTMPLAPELDAALGAAPLLVAGSTHDGEERAACLALERAEAAGQALALVLAPRHLVRCEEVEARLQRQGRTVRRRTCLGPGPLRPGQVLLLDTLGELPALYARASVAFVGGTLVPVGGHNLLEPVEQGRPVLFGPSTSNARDAARLLENTGAGLRVADSDALAEAVLQVLGDAPAWLARAEAGRAALEQHRGATGRTLALIDRACAGGGEE